MPKEALDLQKHTMNFYRGDMEELRTLFPTVEPTVLVRETIHDLIQRARANDPKAVLTERVAI